MVAAVAVMLQRAAVGHGAALLRGALVPSAACRMMHMRASHAGLAALTSSTTIAATAAAGRSSSSGIHQLHQRPGATSLMVGRCRGLSSSAAAPESEKAKEKGDTAMPAGAAPAGDVPWFVPRFLRRESSVAPDGFSRWKAVPGSFLVQVSIGSVYSFSIFNEPLTRCIGVVASGADDWALVDVMPVFSACALSLGICTAVLGPWAERVGPRLVAATAAMCWSSGLMLTGLGCLTHTAPLLYLGYGLLGGAGWGLGYISPVSTLIKWFPDRRGVASGLALTAFGGGGLVATPINELLLRYYYRAPDYLGHANAMDLVTEAGRRYAEVAGELKEVLVVTAHDVANLPGQLDAGVYLLGTGSSGCPETFATLGCAYFALMMAGASMMRVPQDGWAPAGWTPPPADAGSMVTQHHVSSSQALRTPQFYLLWFAVFGNAIAGVTVLSSAKTLMADVFGEVMPHIVTGSFAATFVAGLSGANMLGRLGWSSASDWLGRKNTYYLFGLSVPVTLLLPTVAQYAAQGDFGVYPLVAFISGSALVVSFYGAVFSVLPAYLADVFGQRHVGAIHGRLLTAWSGAALCGPAILSFFRTTSYATAVRDLATKVDPVRFEAVFGAPVAQLEELIAAKTVTISRLMDLAPAHVVDPTPMLYNSALYSMSGILALAFVCNAAMRPVDPKHHLPLHSDVVLDVEEESEHEKEDGEGEQEAAGSDQKTA